MPWTIERKHDHVVVVTMNTNKVNAQNPMFFDDLHAAFDRLETEGYPSRFLFGSEVFDWNRSRSISPRA